MNKYDYSIVNQYIKVLERTKRKFLAIYNNSSPCFEVRETVGTIIGEFTIMIILLKSKLKNELKQEVKK